MRRYRALENRGPHDRAQAPAILGKFKKVCRVGRKPFPPLRTLSGALCPSALQTPLRSTCVPFRPPSDPGGSSPMRGAPCTEHHVYRRITAFSRPVPVGPARASKAGRVDINPAQLGHVWTRRRKACCGPHVTCGVPHRTSGRTKALRCDCANAPRPPLETRRRHPVVGGRLDISLVVSLVIRLCARTAPGPPAGRKTAGRPQSAASESAASETFRLSGKTTHTRAQPFVTIMKKQPALYVRDFDGPRGFRTMLQGPGADRGRRRARGSAGKTQRTAVMEGGSGMTLISL